MNSSEIASHIVEDLILDMFEIGDSPAQYIFIEKPNSKVVPLVIFADPPPPKWYRDHFFYIFIFAYFP